MPGWSASLISLVFARQKEFMKKGCSQLFIEIGTFIDNHLKPFKHLTFIIIGKPESKISFYKYCVYNNRHRVGE